MKNDGLKNQDGEKTPEVRALAVIKSFQEGNLLTADLGLGDGVENLTTPVLKFTEPGQTVIGLYIGNVDCPSSMQGENDYFKFHTVILQNGLEAGFCGSKALDDALGKKQPFRFIVFIKYTEEKKVVRGKFKQFQIMAIDMQNENNPLYKLKDNPFVVLYKRFKENNPDNWPDPIDKEGDKTY